MPRYESDVCIIGSGISAALLAQKLSELVPDLAITMVEAGRTVPESGRADYRQRAMDYGENPWPGDVIEDQEPAGGISRTMTVGGLALHFGGIMQRFSQEDLRLRSMYGLAVDWPLEWIELERFYCEAERRTGVAGEPGPFAEDQPSQPYPMPAMELTWNLVQLKGWAEKTGTRFWSTPVCKNTVPYDGRNVCMRCGRCGMCPIGARYSPDQTLSRLLGERKIVLHDRTLIRRLIPHDERPHIVAAQGVHEERPKEMAEYRARLFVIASGYLWSSHLLLLSASSRFPGGLANRSGLVGRYMNGHAFVSSIVELDAEVYPGMNPPHSLVSRRFLRCPPGDFYLRHDFRIWEAGHRARLRRDDGGLLLGDAALDDWRARARRARARLRAYYDVHPDRDSALTLDPRRQNRYGDPLPRVSHRLDRATQGRLEPSRELIRRRFEELARHDDGRIVSTQYSTYLDHPAGGCRMGTDPLDSVTDSFGRTHDHPNLYVVGAPTLPTGGCVNGTLTFAALTLRSANRIGADLGSVPVL